MLTTWHAPFEKIHADRSRYLEILPVTLSPCASLRGNSAKGLARRAERSFASLRMTVRTPLQSASWKPSLQTSPITGRFLTCNKYGIILELVIFAEPLIEIYNISPSSQEKI